MAFGYGIAAYYQSKLKTLARQLDANRKSGNDGEAEKNKLEFETGKKVADEMTQVEADVFFSPFKWAEIYRRAAQA